MFGFLLSRLTRAMYLVLAALPLIWTTRLRRLQGWYSGSVAGVMPGPSLQQLHQRTIKPLLTDLRQPLLSQKSTHTESSRDRCHILNNDNGLKTSPKQNFNDQK